MIFSKKTDFTLQQDHIYMKFEEKMCYFTLQQNHIYMKFEEKMCYCLNKVKSETTW